MNAPHAKAKGLLFYICATCAVFLLFVLPSFAEAARIAPFIPSETLNPDCGPNDPNCYVQPFVVQDEGVSMTNFARGLNFIGGGVQVTADNAGIISVRVTRGPVAVGEINWNEFRSSGVRLATSTYQVLIGANSTTSLAKLEVVGDQVIRGGSLGIGTTSPFKELSVVGSAWFTGTVNAQKFNVTGNSGTSTFNGITGDLLNITGNSTSTFNKGINLASGCFSINGNCLGNNASGSNRQIQFNNNGAFDAEAAFTYNSTTNTLHVDNLIADFDTTLNNFTFVDATGTRATTTSFSTSNLSVVGNSTSTFNRGVNILGGCLAINGVCVGNGTTSPAGINRQIQFNDNGVFGSDTGFIYNNNTNTLSVQNLNITGVGTTTLNAGLQTTNINLLGSATSTAVNGLNLTGGCFSVNGACVGGETSPAGSNRQIQFNNNGSFGVDAGFTYNVNTNTLSSQNLSISGRATSTDFFANTASTSNLFATTARLGTTTIGSLTVSGSATTTFGDSIAASSINLYGQATSSAQNGINISNGCFAVNGNCVGGGAGTPAGINRQIQFNNNGSFGADAGFTYNSNTSVFTAPKLTVSAGATLSGLTFATSTGISATTTNSFATLASSTNLFSTTANIGNSSITGLLTVANILTQGSTTLQNLTFTLATGTSATTTNFSTSNLSVTGNATSTFVGGGQFSAIALVGSATSTAQNGINITSGCFAVNGTCFTGGATVPGGANRQVQFNQNGVFGGDAGFTYNTTSNILTVQKLLVGASTTLSGFTFATSTGISATTTNSFATVASSTNLFSTNASLGATSISGQLTASSILSQGSTTLRGLNFISATGTSATTTNFSTSNLSVTGNATSTFVGGISSARLQTTATSTISGIRVESGGLSIASLDCSTFANGGKLTTNAQGVLSCGNDLGGGVGGALSNENTALGTRALQSYTSGYWNTAVGYNSLMDLTTGFGNTALGDNAMASTTSGHSNVGIGFSALSSNTTGFMNIGIGYNALKVNDTGRQNIGIGSTALASNTDGVENVAIGTNALAFNTIGSYNTALGASTLNFSTTARINSAVGYHALSSNRTGNENSAFGGEALNLNVSGSYNSAFGNEALWSNINASSSSAFGYQALRNQISGGTSTAFGVWAGKSNVSGSGLTLLGGEADVTAGNLVNASAIGYKAQVATSNALVLGGTGAQAVVVGIGTTTPFATLSLVGNIFASTTATSTFQGNGINITGGCFSIRGTCISSGAGTPAGGDTQLQFNDAGSFAGDTTLSFNKNSKILSINSINVSAGANLSGINFATSTGISATTTNSFAVNQIVTNLQVNGLSTTTFVNNGINLSGGCFAVRGSCVFGGDGGPATIAGLNRQIQYNKNGSFGADAEFTYFDTTDTLNTGNIVLTGQFSVPIADITNVLRVVNTVSVVGGLTTIDNRGVITNGLRVTGLATSSFNNGIDLTTGCLAFNGICSQIINTDSNLSVNSVNVSDSYKLGGQRFISSTNNSNTFIGKFAGAGNIDNVGSANTFIGYAAGSSTVNTGGNVAIGYYSMANADGGIENIAIGNYALMNTTLFGNANTAIGDEAMYDNTDGHHNAAIGQFALRGNTTGFENVAIGHSALNVNTTGFENVAIGYHAGIQNTTGSSNTFIGFNSGSLSPSNISKSIGIGWNASPGASNVIVFGAALLGNEVNVGIGTTTPLYRLQVKNLSGTDVAKFEGNNGTFCTLNSNSGLSCTSDERLKKDIVEINASSSLQSIMSLRPVTYHWLFEDNASSSHAGFIAQEVEKVLPELISTDNESGYKALSTVGLIPILTNALQEQQRIIGDLKLKIDNLATTTTQQDLVNGLLSFSGRGVSIMGDVHIDGHVLLGKDSAGVVVIASGEVSKEVNFNGVYGKKPVVIVTPRELLPENTSYYVTAKNDSFTIVISKPAESRITFSWIAVEGEVEDEPENNPVEVLPIVNDNNATNTPQDILVEPPIDNNIPNIDANLLDQVAPIVDDVVKNVDDVQQ